MISSSANWASPFAIRPIATGCGLCSKKSMQARAFEKAAAVARLDSELHRLAVAINRQRDFDAGVTLRPDAAEETRKVAHILAGDREHDVAGAQISLLCRAAIGQTDNDQTILDLGRIEPEPRPRRRVAAAELHEIVDDRVQQIDRYHHVDVL